MDSAYLGQSVKESALDAGERLLVERQTALDLGAVRESGRSETLHPRGAPDRDDTHQAGGTSFEHRPGRHREDHRHHCRDRRDIGDVVVPGPEHRYLTDDLGLGIGGFEARAVTIESARVDRALEQQQQAAFVATDLRDRIAGREPDESAVTGEQLELGTGETCLFEPGPDLVIREQGAE